MPGSVCQSTCERSFEVGSQYVGFGAFIQILTDRQSDVQVGEGIE